jgi:hypothetical protein
LFKVPDMADMEQIEDAMAVNDLFSPGAVGGEQSGQFIQGFNLRVLSDRGTFFSLGSVRFDRYLFHHRFPSPLQTPIAVSI